ncbi:hypothetical protein MAR_022655 [Mya arenaria]|uniref:Uncharacterized protein n=1 Tax=Mya arenaria TaxID=6604 RepID=A0ABY7DNI3_MYAAR|nr:hypothetical protein MAR_022655 [Mya arenaria]
MMMVTVKRLLTNAIQRATVITMYTWVKDGKTGLTNQSCVKNKVCITTWKPMSQLIPSHFIIHFITMCLVLSMNVEFEGSSQPYSTQNFPKQSNNHRKYN